MFLMFLTKIIKRFQNIILRCATTIQKKLESIVEDFLLVIQLEFKHMGRFFDIS